jgi:hypothetical protein
LSVSAHPPRHTFPILFSEIAEKTNKLGKQGKEHSVGFPKTMLYESFWLPNTITA